MWQTFHVERPKQLAPTKLSQERRSHGHHSIDHLNPTLNRGASSVAV